MFACVSARGAVEAVDVVENHAGNVMVFGCVHGICWLGDVFLMMICLAKDLSWIPRLRFA